MTIDIRLVGAERHEEAVLPVMTSFGRVSSPERVERGQAVTEHDTRMVAFDGETVVGAASIFSFDMSTPGGRVSTAGLTMVAVMPTHRRQGVLTALIRKHLDEARARGQAIAALWASEASIYGRFGYGLASFAGEISVERDRAHFADPSPFPFRARFVGEEEGLSIVSGIWEKARAEIPGMPSRSPSWWRIRRLSDPAWARPGGTGALHRVVIEVEGRPEAYALYRLRSEFDHMIPVGAVVVHEAVGASHRGTRAVWRYLFDVDAIMRIEAINLPVDHPLFLLVAEPRRLRYQSYDALWVRIVHVEEALAARTYGTRDALVLEVEDALCPWNAGRFRLDGGAGRATRTEEAPHLRVPITALGAAYLGGISFRRMADAGLIEERVAGAVERADGIFRSPRAPWCPEQF
jgi:predicted acetyltransferase